MGANIQQLREQVQIKTKQAIGELKVLQQQCESRELRIKGAFNPDTPDAKAKVEQLIRLDNDQLLYCYLAFSLDTLRQNVNQIENGEEIPFVLQQVLPNILLINERLHIESVEKLIFQLKQVFKTLTSEQAEEKIKIAADYRLEPEYFQARMQSEVSKIAAKQVQQPQIQQPVVQAKLPEVQAPMCPSSQIAPQVDELDDLRRRLAAL